MRKIFLFMMVSLDGYFEGTGHDISWHTVDEEFNTFAIDQLKKSDLLLFGRRTYELMVSYWPTDAAKQDDPMVAKLMNKTSKIVFSRTLEKAEWENTRLIREDLDVQLAKLKESKGKDIAIFGSNTLAVSLLELGLLDEVRIMVSPVAIGKGTSLFKGLKKKVHFSLEKTRKFENGNILLYYSV